MTKMSDQPGEESAAESPADYGRRLDMAFEAAREFLRLQFQEDGCVTGIREVLEHLDARFGRSVGMTTDVDLVLGLCATLWEDPHVDQVAEGYIEFCWNEVGHRPGGVGPGSLHALLAARLEREGLS